MKRIGLLIASAIVVLLLLDLAFSPFVVWDGQFTVSVSIKSRSSLPIRHVAYVFAGLGEQEHLFEAVKDFDGTKFAIDVPCSGRSWLGINYGYVQPRFVVFRVDGGTDKRLKTVVEIPRGAGQNGVCVEIP
jgi:hypothetical protein